MKIFIFNSMSSWTASSAASVSRHGLLSGAAVQCAKQKESREP